MGKNLTLKAAAIIAITILAIAMLYPADKKLKPGIDLAGGSSLIYEIDDHGMDPDQRKNLAQNMITIIRRRVDPANLLNIVWRVLSSNRFEIQMPLASPLAREKRAQYEQAMTQLLDKNISTAKVLRILQQPEPSRTDQIKMLNITDEKNKAVLQNILAVHDQRQLLRNAALKQEPLLEELKTQMEKTQVNADDIDANMDQWLAMDEPNMAAAIEEFAGSKKKAKKVNGYVLAFKAWAGTVEQLTDPEIGKNIQFTKAKKQLDNLNISAEQMNNILEMKKKSSRRQTAIDDLKQAYPDRKELVDKVVASFEEYRPHKGKIDDPKDIQRMLKGSGVLEFRILPTAGRSELNNAEINGYRETIREKGPKAASDTEYIWCEIENPDEWLRKNSDGTITATGIVETFGEKYYVLASNKTEETMLHSAGKKWKLERASVSRDQQGKRAIAFSLNDRGAIKFAAITGDNINRPLCITLDSMALSAPNIQSKIFRSGIITGSFSVTEVQDMIQKLNAGSLPARLSEQPISEKTIGPAIGADNRDKGVKAGFYGLMAVMACMLFYYTLAGGIADVALILNILFVLAIMAFSKATFTLPGIGGIILTIGMSVDANVLIFERIREEQTKGSSMRTAIQNGYSKAFTTIFDANLTTFITAAILFWVASEEIKGFAIVLMLGIISSMFTALFVTRVIFELLMKAKIIKEHLVMMRILKKPNVDWMRLRPVFMTISAIMIIGGLLVFFTRDESKNKKYDIEFTGGSAVIVNFKNDMTIQQVRDEMIKTGQALQNPDLAASNIYSINNSLTEYEITTTATNAATVTISFDEAADISQEKIEKKLSSLTKLVVTQNPDGEFTIVTAETNSSRITNLIATNLPEATVGSINVKETVSDAIVAAFGDNLKITKSLKPNVISNMAVTDNLVDINPELASYNGGVKIEMAIANSATAKQVRQRLNDYRIKPEARNIKWHKFEIMTDELKAPAEDQLMDKFIYVSAADDAVINRLTDKQMQLFADVEKNKLIAALSIQSALPRVTQINPSIGQEAKTQALIAIVLSLIAIVGYIWVRFGNLRYGFAAIAALVHDVCITLGAVTGCTYMASTALGQSMLIGDFKINLAIIAAFLTIIGYSLNDTIVIFDRIRENRHKKMLTKDIINNSINQTLLRTLATSITTFIVVLIMYIFGGDGLRGFTFAIGFGIIVGTYSSVAIAAPILLFGAKKDK